MKVSTATFATLFTVAASAFAQTVISPTPGQVLSASEPFNLTYFSQRYFEESSIKISVVTAPADGSFPGGAPVLDLAPTSHSPVDSSAIYSTMVSPITLYNGPQTGNHTVYVIETYNAYGGLPGIDVLAVPVTFV
ncbi:hypothetical protein DFH07DRAFT_798517 [Mycena maculata]|uniref:Uncharacterized protein n=1 Tax=Mycena maculata TaxID=230809 RepID=A0AAD7K1W3_9AGAR|nr:hypothetical protein DFH07DRAFT_798517 [Mycena maculata]